MLGAADEIRVAVVGAFTGVLSTVAGVLASAQDVMTAVGVGGVAGGTGWALVMKLMRDSRISEEYADLVKRKAEDAEAARAEAVRERAERQAWQERALRAEAGLPAPRPPDD